VKRETKTQGWAGLETYATGRTDWLVRPTPLLFLAMADLRAHATLLLPQFPATLARFLNSHEILLQ
jgi:hypothetical protein